MSDQVKITATTSTPAPRLEKSATFPGPSGQRADQTPWALQLAPAVMIQGSRPGNATVSGPGRRLGHQHVRRRRGSAEQPQVPDEDLRADCRSVSVSRGLIR